MSSISVAGDVSGAISIAAPSAAGSGVLTLPTGTDTLVGKATTDTLTNKSIAATQLTGTIAASALPAGSVLQVVNATYSTLTAVSSATYADTGLTATITPKFNTSKILVLVSQSGINATTAANGTNVQLLRGASILSVFAVAYGYGTVNANAPCGASVCYLDSPATTSSTTYKTQFARYGGSGQVQVQDNSDMSTITLMEIAG